MTSPGVAEIHYYTAKPRNWWSTNRADARLWHAHYYALRTAKTLGEHLLPPGAHWSVQPLWADVMWLEKS
jgi:hypothetical protein